MRINHLIWQMVKPVCYWQNGMFLRSGLGTEAMKNETFEQIKELPLVSSNVSFGYGISGIAHLKVLTNNLKRNDYNSLLTNLLSYKVNFKGKNRYRTAPIQE